MNQTIWIVIVAMIALITVVGILALFQAETEDFGSWISEEREDIEDNISDELEVDAEDNSNTAYDFEENLVRIQV